jgi:hypothetical protein
VEDLELRRIDVGLVLYIETSQLGGGQVFKKENVADSTVIVRASGKIDRTRNYEKKIES